MHIKDHIYPWWILISHGCPFAVKNEVSHGPGIITEMVLR